MLWLDKIRQRPREQKIRIIWTATLLAAVLLIILWVISARLTKDLPKDTSLFKTFLNGVKDIKDSYKK